MNASKTTSLQLVSHNPEQTQDLGVHLGKLANAGDVFLLTGNLGSGKTCLTQGIARGLGIKEYTSSPSFIIIREHHGSIPLYHMDFYRLDYIEEITDLGLEEYFYGNGVCVVEWAKKGINILPKNHLLIDLSYISYTVRSLSIEAEGNRYSQLLQSLCKDLKTWS